MLSALRAFQTTSESRWKNRSRISRQILHRSCGRRAPANGLEWRSSSANSLRSTRKAATEETSPFRISAHFLSVEARAFA